MSDSKTKPEANPSEATPKQEGVARHLCTDAGLDPDQLGAPGMPDIVHTPAGVVVSLRGEAVPLWHFWVPSVKATEEALATVEAKD